MKKKTLIGSLIAVVLLVLVSIAPTINASVVKDELVEFKVELCRIDGLEYNSIYIKRNELIELQIIIEEIKNKLSRTTSREEGIVVYDWAVEKLHRYGIFGDLNIEQAKRLVCGKYHFQYYDYISTNLLKDWNFLCLIYGEVDYYGLLTRILAISIILVYFGIVLALIIPPEERPFNIIDLMFNLGLSLVDFEGGRTKYFLNLLHIGFPHLQIDYGTYGWIESIGVLGKREISGLIVGDIYGFSGIRICGVGEYNTFFLGTGLFSHVEYAEY